MMGTERCRNQNRSSIQVDQPTSREKVESRVGGGCARGGNKTKEDRTVGFMLVVSILWVD